MKIYKTNKGYYYKEYDDGRKIRLSYNEWMKFMKKEEMIKKIYFYDDSIHEFKNKNNFKFIKTFFIKEKLYHNYDDYLNILSDDTLSFINLYHSKIGKEKKDIKGVNKNELKSLYKKILKNELDIVVFDWDYTLSIFEGWFSDKTFDEIKYYINDTKSETNNYAEYILGGYERIRLLKKIFNNKKNIPIYILTNNLGLANPKYFIKNRYNYYNLLKSVGIKIPIKNILFNTYQPGNKLLFINEIILKKNKSFHKILHKIFMLLSELEIKHTIKKKNLLLKNYNDLIRYERNQKDYNDIFMIKQKCLVKLYT